MLAAALWACSEITGDLRRVVAIEIVGSLTPRLEEGDTLRLEARAIDAAGDSVPGAAIVWESVDTGQVGFTLDSATGLVSGVAPGSGRVQARVEALTSGTLRVTVTAAPDSLAPDIAMVTLPLGQSAAPALSVLVWDLTTSPGQQLALPGKAVHFLLIDPPPGGAAAGGLVLAVGDTVQAGEPHRVTATSQADGRASVVVRRVSGTVQPDSALLQAIALTARGDTVAGSPLPLLVRIEND